MHLNEPMENFYITECRRLKPALEVANKGLNADLKVRSTRVTAKSRVFSVLYFQRPLKVCSDAILLHQ